MSGAVAVTDVVVLAAPAKVNLHLGIYPGHDGQGYHRADSLMVALDVADEVVVRRVAPGSGLSVRCEPPLDLAPEKNTAYRAAVALARAVEAAGVRDDAPGRGGAPSRGDVPGRGDVPSRGARAGQASTPDIEILIRKRVPSQAGLGGASSDAASVLMALGELWGIAADDPVLAEAARSVGADVAFFLDPVPTLLVGRGDVVAEKFKPLVEPVPVVLVRPAGEGVSTPAAYRDFDKLHEGPGDPAGLCELLRAGRVTSARVAGLLSNNLDPVACRLQPTVRQVRDWLRGQDLVLGAQVSGSGSCVFGICATSDDAQAVAREATACFGPDTWARATSFR